MMTKTKLISILIKKSIYEKYFTNKNVNNKNLQFITTNKIFIKLNIKNNFSIITKKNSKNPTISFFWVLMEKAKTNLVGRN